MVFSHHPGFPLQHQHGENFDIQIFIFVLLIGTHEPKEETKTPGGFNKSSIIK
jgi:hypothetical protein